MAGVRYAASQCVCMFQVSTNVASDRAMKPASTRPRPPSATSFARFFGTIFDLLYKQSGTHRQGRWTYKRNLADDNGTT